MSFIFYDTETTGTNTSFDQILQFAAIRTDENLNELDRYETRCRLDPHIVPSAGAFRVTGMTIERVTDASLPSHYEMVCEMRERLAGWCPATFVGWNSMWFDEKLLRQAFYKCLYPPYFTNTQGNQRSDIMKLAQCVEAFAPGILNVPTDARGKPSYKLDRLAPANGFAHLNAHDAMGDVEATIHICRLIRERAPHAWEQLLHCASKARVCPESLPDHIREEEERHLAARLTGHGCDAPPWTTLAAADEDAAAMQLEGNPDHAGMLEAFRAHIAVLLRRAADALT